MTKEERIKNFKEGKVAVLCESEKEASDFVLWCYCNGIYWKYDKEKMKSYFVGWDIYYAVWDNYLVHGDYEDVCKKQIIKYKDFFKEDEMTNLEYVIKSIKKNEPDCRRMLCDVIYEFKNKTPCCGKCPECEFSTHINVLEYLAEKHEEKHDDKIKVTQFEYDLLDSLKKTYSAYSKDRMKKFPIFTHMKEKGYFKNIENLKRLGDVYERLEVEK